MSSENRPVRKAWTRHARSLALRRWLLVALGVALVAWAAAAIVRHHKAALHTPAIASREQTAKPDESKAPPHPPETVTAPKAMLKPGGSPPTPTAAAASPPVAPVAPATSPMTALRSAPEGENALILGVPALAPSPAPQVELPPATAAQPTSPQPAAPAAQAVTDLPTVAVASPGFHVVPSDEETKQLGTVTLSNRQGRTVAVVSPAAPAQRRATSNPSATVATAVPPQLEGFAPVAIPAVFSGRAQVTGPLTLDVQGQAVQLFGVTIAPPPNRCAGPNGTAQSCGALAQAALTQKLAGHSIVACRVPPGQHGALGAICLDEQGNDLGRYLVIEGFALADPNQSYDYLPAEGAARSAKRGLWHFR